MKPYYLSLPFSLMLCFLLGQAAAVKAQSSPVKTDLSISNEPFINWAKANAISLQETDKAVGYDDLQPLKKMMGNARVVGLGEASHGMHEPQAFRNRLFKYLVEQCGFTTIVLEAGIAESEEATTFVANGTGSPQSGAKKMTIANASPENIELMEWMRQYNTNPLHEIKLKWYGMDMQMIGYPGDTVSRHAAIDITLRYLRKIDPESAVKITAALLPYMSRLSVANYPALNQQDHDRLSATLDDMIALIERERINFIAKSSENEYNWAHRIAIAARQTDRLARVTPLDPPGNIPPGAWVAVNTRDAAMADNIKWIADNLAGGKVLVYSHNAHVKNATTSGGIWDAFTRAPHAMGQYLKSALGDDYFVIGTSIYPEKKTAQPGSVDLALLDVGKPCFVVDLKAAAASDPRVKSWLSVIRPMEANVHFFLNMPIGTAFNALVLLDKSAPVK
jgi:erythromycin esterase